MRFWRIGLWSDSSVNHGRGAHLKAGERYGRICGRWFMMYFESLAELARARVLAFAKGVSGCEMWQGWVLRMAGSLCV
jgi:hypothetical protein